MKKATRRTKAGSSSKRAGADQGVHVQVLPEILAPGVQHQGGGDLPTEPARIGAEFE